VTANGLWQDVRYGLQMMRRSPGFTAAAVLSLGLGIGANTAIYSLLYAILLHPLPIEHPERLVEFLVLYPGDPPLNFFSQQSYQHFRDHNHVFSGITASHLADFHLRADGRELERVVGECVAGNFFQTLGVRPALGRLIGNEAAEAVVSWSYWNNKFNLDRAILGKRIVVEGMPLTIVGVTPRNFSGLQPGKQPDIWIPLTVFERGPLQLIARLRPGVTITQARAEMAVLFAFTIEERARASDDPVMRQLKFRVEPAGAGLSTALRRKFANPLVALMAVVALLLLIACMNVGGLLLARGTARTREMAVRVSLGASRFRLVRQVLTESLLLAAAGGVLGIFLAYAGDSALVSIMTSGRFVGGPPRIEIHILPDMNVLLFTGGIALLTGVLFGLAPAWSAFAPTPASALRGTAKAADTRFRRTFGKSMVVAQVALSVGLVSAAGLFIGNLSNLEHTDLGFRRDHVLLVTLDAAGKEDSDEARTHTYLDLLAHFEKIPGVRSVATLAGSGPLSGAGASRFITVDGHPERSEDRRYVFVNWVGPKYFETLGTALLAGRDFKFEDRGRARVAIINEAMARFYFGGRPIGKYVTFDGDPLPFEVIGVVGDAKYFEIREAAPRTIYLNAFQTPRPPSTFALRTNFNPFAVAPAARRVVREILRDVPVVRVTTLADQVDATIVPERLVAFLSGALGGLGALLAALGIYGILAYTVARRINEIGIRMALGATRGDVIQMVLVEALGMVSAGLAVGVPIAIWGKRFAASLIADLAVTGAAPVAFAVVAMIAVALLATYVPARRAAGVEPVEALRYD